MTTGAKRAGLTASLLTVTALSCMVAIATDIEAQQETHEGKPVLENPDSSALGTDYFSQGGVVVDGIAYFTADQSYSKYWKGDDFPFVVSFDVATFGKRRTYAFEDTYDSSPLVVQRSDGKWLVIAHEYKLARTVAMDRDTGDLIWISPANQQGAYFFGYSYFVREDGSKLLFAPSQNGLHALSCDTGEEVWWVQVTGTGGVTPCVDQQRGVVYYQTDGRVMKIRAQDGEILRETPVQWPRLCVSWNTVLADDEHGRYIATYWFAFTDPTGEQKQMQYTGGLRVFDADLNLVWEKTGLPSAKKCTLTYARGKLVLGTGGHWGGKYEGTGWKYLPAYDIATGEMAWKCDLTNVDYQCIMNVPYAYGRFFAETMGTKSTLLCVNAETGELEQTLEYGTGVGSCAPPIIARGLMLSGDLGRDGVVVSRLAEGCVGDWPGPFGNPQTNTYALPDSLGVQVVPMAEVKPKRQ